MKKILTLSFAICISLFLKVLAQCPAPKINNFSPATGFIGSIVTINGAYFDSNPNNNQVFFGAAKATVVSASFSTLTVIAPIGGTTALISVKNNCNKIAYSCVPFNGIFCPAPLTSSTYENTSYQINAKGAFNMNCYDMDLDSKPDLISGGLIAGGFTIARNTSTPGNLSFSGYDISCPGPSQQVIADFDGDGKLDIIFASNGPIQFLRNTSSPGTLNFDSYLTLTSNLNFDQISAGDFNNDGKIDFVAEGGNILRTYINNSSGSGNISFAANITVNVGGRCTGIQCVDVDGDGLTDILATQGDYDRVISLRNSNTSNSNTFSFESPEFWNSGGLYPFRCQIGDFDKDGKIDLITCNFNGTANTAILRNSSSVGDISFATSVNLSAPASNFRIVVGDVNGDGLPDIVTRSLSMNVFSVYPNISSGPGSINFDSRIDYTSSAMAEINGIAVADLDGDYIPDIATSGIFSNTIRIHRNTSSHYDTTPPIASCKNISVALNTFGSVTVSAAMIDNGSSDACGISSILIDNDASKTFSCSDIGANTVTLKVIDRSNNTSTCNAIITVTAATITTLDQTTVCDGDSVLLTANSGDSYQWYNNSNLILGATNQTYTATITGSYQVEVNNSGGCSGTSSATSVTVNTNPTVDLTPSGSAPLCNGSAVLTASTSSLYQWKLNGNDIQGATQQSFNATSTGTYSVKVVDLFGCSATSNGIVVNNTPPEIDITGNGNSIIDGDNTPSNTDETMLGFYGSGTSTFTIKNLGSGNLRISSITIDGENYENFTLGGISFPTDISANGSKTFTVTFNLSNLGTKNATVNISTNDCNESHYNFDIYGELSCTTPEFISCPENIEVSASGTACDAIVTYTPEISGIPEAELTYLFDGATTGSGNGDGSGSNFNVGTTTVSLIASNACGTVICSFNITVNGTNPNITITQSDLPEFCQGGSIKLTANATGGESFEYLWSNEATTKTIEVQSGADYTVFVINNFGCTASASTTVAYNISAQLSSYTILATDEIELEEKSEVQTGGVGAYGCNGEIEVEDKSKITGSTTFAKAKNIDVSGGSTVTTKYYSAVSVDLPNFKYNPYCENECKSKHHKHCDKDCKDSKHSHCKSDCKERNHSERCHSKYHKNCNSSCKNKNHNHCKSSCKDDDHNHCKHANCNDEDHHHCAVSCHTKYHKNCNSGCNNSSHVHCKSNCNNSSHNHCSHANCKGKNDITVGSNKSVTLTDSIYGKISVGKNSTVTFTSDVVYIKELKTSDDVTVKFTEQCVKMMVCDDVELKKDNQFNSTGKTVVMYVEHDFKASENSVINSSIYSLDEIKVEGDCNNVTKMTGLFIAEKVKSEYTWWNWNTNCGGCDNLNKKSSFAADLQGTIDPTQISFNVYPNPNKGDFGIDIITNQTGTLQIAVIDLLGRTVYSETQTLSGPVFVPINLPTAANGQYVVRALINGQAFTKYIVINK
jgi:hypothetical protein